MNQLETLLADINSQATNKRISKEIIKDLGYNLSENKIIIKAKTSEKIDDDLTLYELKEVDDLRRDVDFCFLWSKLQKSGTILKAPFKKYKDLIPKKNSAKS